MNETPPSQVGPSRSQRVRHIIVWILQVVMAIGLLLAAYRGHWLDVLTIAGIVLLMALPMLFGRRYKITIPPEFELMAILFVFASLFLGEMRGYYTRFWWWDIALHTSSGLLLGIFGFLLIYLLNEDSKIDLSLRPRFVALFAFFFAVAIGALWEIFEFSMDQLAGMNMQKPMAGDPSGLTDTMWDLIVDTVGASIVSLIGWWHMRMQRQSLFDGWIRKFVDANPQLFR
ncbi:MAG: hypothetical protein HKN49_01235 [Gammaproteobacteria bacterium]|nr:hypothetical protein [Gammaproteobacteria bacterium]